MSINISHTHTYHTYYVSHIHTHIRTIYPTYTHTLHIPHIHTHHHTHTLHIPHIHTHTLCIPHTHTHTPSHTHTIYPTYTHTYTHTSHTHTTYPTSDLKKIGLDVLCIYLYTYSHTPAYAGQDLKRRRAA